MNKSYDAIIVGTGFAGAFFLMRYLERAPATARVLVLERGRVDSKEWQLQNRRTSSLPSEGLFINRTPEKEWATSPGFGGNSKCWWGGTTRMMPADFKLKSRHGVGIDWPLSYDDLEGYYGVVEDIMSISGPPDSPMPRSRPFPLPPHRFSDPDALLKKAFPDSWFHPATARASAATGQRGVCCGSGICWLCPTDAKFTIQNGLSHIYEDSRVTLQLEAVVQGIRTRAKVATGVDYVHGLRDEHATADVVVLAASALFNPHILLRSGISHPLLGKRLHEQKSVDVCVDLAGVKAYNGSTAISGNGYLFYESAQRRQSAGCLIETWNAPFVHDLAALRSERGRQTERAYFRFVFDELPRDDNSIVVNAANPALPEARFYGYSSYAERGAARIPMMIDKLATALPIERIESILPANTSSHIQGTVVMGNDPAQSIVDRHLVHHQLSNLLVLGSSAYPTASPSYPTLTISALSLWAADHLFASKA